MARVWTLVLDHAHQSVLMALADHADDNGNNVFPSVEYIAWKTGYGRRQVQRIMSYLRKRGVIVQVAGARLHRPIVYRLNLSAVPSKPPFKPRGDKMSPLRTERGATNPATWGDIPDARGDISCSRDDMAMSPEPSLEPSLEPSENHHAQAQELWCKVLHELKPSMTRGVFTDVFRDTVGIKLAEGTLTVGAPNQRKRQLLAARWAVKVERCLGFIAGRAIRVDFKA